MSTSIAEEYGVFLVDVDGVVLVDGEPVSGAVTALDRLREAGNSIRFVTNNSRASREEIAYQLTDAGIEAAVDEIVSSAWATARYLAENNVESAYPIGAPGLMDELRTHGIRLRERSVDAAVVGLDRSVTYGEIEIAASRIRHDGAAFVAANVDATLPTADGVSPGTGAIVAAVEAVAGESPTAVGKPDPRMFRLALEDLPESEAVMIGDSPRSDIEGARRAGIAGVLVSDSPAEDLAASPADVEPDGVIADLAELFESR